MSAYSVAGVNALDYETFVENFSGIFEHSSIVVAVLWSLQPFRDFADLYEKLCGIIWKLPLEGIGASNLPNVTLHGLGVRFGINYIDILSQCAFLGSNKNEILDNTFLPIYLGLIYQTL